MAQRVHPTQGLYGSVCVRSESLSTGARFRYGVLSPSIVGLQRFKRNSANHEWLLSKTSLLPKMPLNSRQKGSPGLVNAQGFASGSGVSRTTFSNKATDGSESGPAKEFANITLGRNDEEKRLLKLINDLSRRGLSKKQTTAPVALWVPRTEHGESMLQQVLQQVVRGPIPPKEAPLFKVVGMSGSGKSSWLKMRLTDLRNLVKRKLAQGDYWAAGKLFQAADFMFLQSILDPERSAPVVVDFNGGGDALVEIDALLTPDQAIGLRVAARLIWGIGAEQLRTHLANMEEQRMFTLNAVLGCCLSIQRSCSGQRADNCLLLDICLDELQFAQQAISDLRCSGSSMRSDMVMQMVDRLCRYKHAQAYADRTIIFVTVAGTAVDSVVQIPSRYGSERFVMSGLSEAGSLLLHVAGVLQERGQVEGPEDQDVALNMQNALSYEGISQEGAAEEGHVKEGAAEEGRAKERAAEEGRAKEGAAEEGRAKERAAEEGRAKEGAAEEGHAEIGRVHERLGPLRVGEEDGETEGESLLDIAQRVFSQPSIRMAIEKAGGVPMFLDWIGGLTRSEHWWLRVSVGELSEATALALAAEVMKRLDVGMLQWLDEDSMVARLGGGKGIARVAALAATGVLVEKEAALGKGGPASEVVTVGDVGRWGVAMLQDRGGGRVQVIMPPALLSRLVAFNLVGRKEHRVPGLAELVQSSSLLPLQGLSFETMCAAREAVSAWIVAEMYDEDAAVGVELRNLYPGAIASDELLDMSFRVKKVYPGRQLSEPLIDTAGSEVDLGKKRGVQVTAGQVVQIGLLNTRFVVHADPLEGSSARAADYIICREKGRDPGLEEILEEGSVEVDKVPGIFIAQVKGRKGAKLIKAAQFKKAFQTVKGAFPLEVRDSVIFIWYTTGRLPEDLINEVHRSGKAMIMPASTSAHWLPYVHQIPTMMGLETPIDFGYLDPTRKIKPLPPPVGSAANVAVRGAGWMTSSF